jgi:hypothetical protein
MSEYYDSAENLMVTRKRACQELKAHGVTDIHEFFEELGFSSHYKAQDVLDWLGY